MRAIKSAPATRKGGRLVTADGSSGVSENNRHRAPDHHDLAHRRQHAADSINSERHDGIRILVGGVQELPAWIEREEARCLAFRRLPADRYQRSTLGIDCKNADAVVPAIGGVDEITRGGHGDLGPGIVAGEVGRGRGDDLHREQDPALRVVAIGDDRRAQLVDDLGKGQSRVEGYVARSRAHLGLREGRVIRMELAGPRVEAEHEDPVQPFVRHGDEASTGIERRVVRV
jgi:hypothetical protein